jgi:hypothetical protein
MNLLLTTTRLPFRRGGMICTDATIASEQSEFRYDVIAVSLYIFNIHLCLLDVKGNLLIRHTDSPPPPKCRANLFFPSVLEQPWLANPLWGQPMTSEKSGVKPAEKVPALASCTPFTSFSPPFSPVRSCLIVACPYGEHVRMSGCPEISLSHHVRHTTFSRQRFDALFFCGAWPLRPPYVGG